MRGRRTSWRGGAVFAVLGSAAVVLGLVSAPATASGSATGSGSGSGSAAASPAATDSWQVAATLSLGTGDTANSCPSSTTCWAIEAGQLLASHDGGSTWSTKTSTVPRGVAALNDITCPKARLCYLTATLESGVPTILVLRSGALAAEPVPATTPLSTIECSSAKHCLASDGTTVVITRDGSHWSVASLPRIISTPDLSCVPGTKQCWIVGDSGETAIIETSSDGGTSWSLQTAPAQTDGMYGVDCPTVTTCYAVGADRNDIAIVIGTHDGGSTWFAQTTPVQPYPLRSVSCASISTCWATGLSPGGIPFVFTTTDTGGHWVAQSLPSGPSGGSPYVSCPTTLLCSAVSGGITYATVDSGATWSDTEVPAGVETPAALSCPGRQTCVGVSNDALGRPTALRSTDRAATWTPHALSPSVGILHDIACPTVSLCYAVSSGTAESPQALVSHALTSTDGGITWTQGTVVDQRGVLTKVTCPSVTTCLAIGYGKSSNVKIVRTTDSGQTWTTVAGPDGAFSLDGISCVSVTSCVLVTAGTQGPPTAQTTDDLGTTYQPHAMPDVDIFDLGCAETTCVAVGADSGDGAIATSNDGGVTWGLATIPQEVQILGGVTCSTGQYCAATGFDFAQGGGPLIVGTRNAGLRWSAFAVPARNEEPLDVACYQATCVASDVSVSGNPLILAGRA